MHYVILYFLFRKIYVPELGSRQVIGNSCSSKQQRIRSPLWLDTTRTLAELEPIINNRVIFLRRRFWFSSISLNQENRSLVFIQFQEVKEHLRIIGSLVRSCSIGLADAAKLVAVLSKIQNPEHSGQIITIFRFKYVYN